MIGRLTAVCMLACLFTALARAEIVETKFDDGKVKQKYVTDEQGKKDGAFTEFFANGKVKIKAVYKADELDGLFTEYFENGKARISATYKADKKNGTFTEFNEQGQKLVVASYKDDKLNGVMTRMEKGVITLQLPFKDGEPAYPRTKEQMAKKIQEILEAPVKGDGLDAERQEALKRLKAYRYICELPYEQLTLDDQYNKLAQAGSALCAKIKRLDHKPANPGLPEAEYKIGFEGTSKSNLAGGYAKIALSVDGYMDDSDPSNINRVGHRRWCLNPFMGKTGFGREGTFSAMYSMDASNQRPPDFDYIAYPTKGWMPIEFFSRGRIAPGAVNTYAWSVSLHPQKYKAADKNVKVRIFELDDAGSKKTSEPLPLNYNTPNGEGMGLRNCLIFRPDKFKLEAGQRFLVEIDGLVRPNGALAPIRYVVDFFSLK